MLQAIGYLNGQKVLNSYEIFMNKMFEEMRRSHEAFIKEDNLRMEELRRTNCGDDRRKRDWIEENRRTRCEKERSNGFVGTKAPFSSLIKRNLDEKKIPAWRLFYMQSFLCPSEDKICLLR